MKKLLILQKWKHSYKGLMMSKTYWVFITVMAALAIFWTEETFSATTTILAPDGTVTVCQVNKNVVICV